MHIDNIEGESMPSLVFMSFLKERDVYISKALFVFNLINFMLLYAVYEHAIKSILDTLGEISSQ